MQSSRCLEWQFSPSTYQNHSGSMMRISKGFGIRKTYFFSFHLPICQPVIHFCWACFLICKMGTVTLLTTFEDQMRCLYSKAHNMYMRLLRRLTSSYCFHFIWLCLFTVGHTLFISEIIHFFIHNKGTSSLYYTGKSSQVQRSISYYYINEL